MCDFTSPAIVSVLVFFFLASSSKADCKSFMVILLMSCKVIQDKAQCTCTDTMPILVIYFKVFFKVLTPRVLGRR